jgi:arylsulfatase A-like enzyme
MQSGTDSADRLSRRDFVRRSIVGAGALGLGMLAESRALGMDPRRPPNFVFFILDDMQRWMFNCLPEGRGYLTPNIDRLAREGTLMMGQHVASPVCTPSRYNCLTGQYASRALAGQAEREGRTVVTWNTYIEPGQVTLPRLLQQAGYRTGFVGKNHVVRAPGWVHIPYEADPRAPAVQAQLEENATAVREAIRGAGFDYAESVYHNNPDGNGPRELAVHNLDWTTAGGLEFLDRYRGSPFFLYFASTIPHGPAEPDRSWNADRRITADGYLEEPPGVLPPRETLRPRVREAGITRWPAENLLWLDDAVGAVLDRLQTHGALDNTIIFFFNDHGQAAKGTLYQGGVSDPTIVWRSGGFPAGGECDALVSNIDFAPTILEYGGADPRVASFDGRSFRPVLEGTAASVHDSVYFELGYARAVRAGDWKYLALRYPEAAENMTLEERQRRLGRLNENLRQRGRPIKTEDPMAPFSHITLTPGGGDAEAASTGKYPAYYDRDQLYSLADDPGEQVNLAGDPQHAAKLAEMKAILRTYLDDLPGGFAELKPETAP